MDFTEATKEAAKARIALTGPAGSGKAQPVDAPALTPAGWRPIGELAVGDEVFASNGEVTRVEGVYPQGCSDIWKITFSDGSTAESTADHLWHTQTVLDRDAKRPGTAKPLSEIATSLTRNGKRNHWVPMVAPMDFPESDSLPLDPWLLGALLGDGGFRGRGVVFSNPDPAIRAEVAAALPADTKIGWSGDIDFGVVGTEHGSNPVLDALRELGLHGKLSIEKSVPRRYLFASAKTRAAVLAGLLDTDGYAGGRTCEFGTSSGQLADDVQFLAESLGCTVHRGSRIPSYVHRGEKRQGQLAWRLSICPPRDCNPFRVQAERFTPRSKYPARRAMVSVERVRRAEAVCIAIAHPSRLYVTSHCIPTHNTYTALMLAFGLGEKVGVIDTERGSASKYVGRNGWHFQTMKPASYAPLSLVEHLGKAAGAGLDVVVIDSLSHYWMGTDGMLEQVDRRSGKSKFSSGWKDVGPEEKRMIDAILAFPGHVIATLRVKTEYVLEVDDRGKQVPRRVGLKPVQRDGIEHEFDLVGDLDLSNVLTVSKSRIEGVETGATYERPGMELAAEVAQFLAEGEQLPTLSEYRQRASELSTRDDLLALYEEVCRHQLDGAPMLDDHGRPTILGDIIKARGREVSAGDAA
ncbi:AAA family ATPase [Nocardia sp. NPDC050697]|uniref:AAA family ATPase n=1 Tax=Nocardia sp. NPDC050697 TaxID=3155158 RepID=UPI00340C9A7C